MKINLKKNTCTYIVHLLPPNINIYKSKERFGLTLKVLFFCRHYVNLSSTFTKTG